MKRFQHAGGFESRRCLFIGEGAAARSRNQRLCRGTDLPSKHAKYRANQWLRQTAILYHQALRALSHSANAAAYRLPDVWLYHDSGSGITTRRVSVHCRPVYDISWHCV